MTNCISVDALSRSALVLTFLFFVASGPAAAQPGNGEFVAHPTDGTPRRGPLERLGEGWSVRLGGADPVRIEAGELLSLRRADRPLPPPPLDEHVLFANGDRLPGAVVGLAGERVLFRLPPEFGIEKEVRL